MLKYDLMYICVLVHELGSVTLTQQEAALFGSSSVQAHALFMTAEAELEKVRDLMFRIASLCALTSCRTKISKRSELASGVPLCFSLTLTLGSRHPSKAPRSTPIDPNIKRRVFYSNDAL